MPAVNAGPWLVAALALSGLSPRHFWVRYVGIGGDCSRAELTTYLNGHSTWSAAEHDLAAHVLNEHCLDLGLGAPAAYAAEILTADPGTTWVALDETG